LEEEPAGGARIIRFLDRLELSPELQEEPGELWAAAEVKRLKCAAAAFPERAPVTGARLGLAEAVLHAAETCLHAASLISNQPPAIGALADPGQ